MLQEMLSWALELQRLFNDGATLRQICKYSYDQRESGRNVPYMKVLTSDGNLRDYKDLIAQPTVKQADLFAFFEELAPGCVGLPKYQLLVTRKGVLFTKRNFRGKGQKVDLLTGKPLHS